MVAKYKKMYSTVLGMLPKLSDVQLAEELLEQYREVVQISEDVKREMGEGYWEEIYRSALAVELRMRDLTVHEEVVKEVMYKGQAVGNVRADIVVYGEKGFLVEVKRGDMSRASWQLAAYLQTFETPVGYIVGFSANKLTVYMVALLEIEGEMRCVVYDGKTLSELQDVGRRV